MKKTIIISIISLGLLFSCKKETTPVEEKVIVTNSDFNEIQQLANLNSDTLYITNYWATWCPPCVKEIPDFVALQKKYEDRKVKFTFVSIDALDDQETEVKPFVKEYKMTNVYQINPEELSELVAISPELGRAIPVTVIQKGEKKEWFQGAIEKEDLSQKIEEFLNNN